MVCVVVGTIYRFASPPPLPYRTYHTHVHTRAHTAYTHMHTHTHGHTHTHAYHTRVHKYQNITHTFSVFPDLQKSLSTIVMNLKRKGPTQRRSLTGVRQSRILLVTPWSVARSSLYIVLCTPFIHAVYPEIHMMPMWSALKIVIIVPCPVHCKICGLAS